MSKGKISWPVYAVGWIGLLVMFGAMTLAFKHDQDLAIKGNLHPNDTGYFTVMGIGACVFIGVMLLGLREALEESRKIRLEREKDPDWPEYQRLRTKFFGGHNA